MGITEIGNKEIDRLLQELDTGSRKMLLYMMKHMHARLDELMEVSGESSHMNTLVRIRNVINPKAIEILKRPVLLFEKSRVDRENGENVFFSWWLTKEDERILQKEENELFADVFDEKDEVLIVLDLKGAREESLKIDVEQNSVRLFFRDFYDREHMQQIPLSRQVGRTKFSKQVQNQILTIMIPKNEQ